MKTYTKYIQYIIFILLLIFVGCSNHTSISSTVSTIDESSTQSMTIEKVISPIEIDNTSKTKRIFKSEDIQEVVEVKVLERYKK